MDLKLLQLNPQFAKDIIIQVKGNDLMIFADQLVKEVREETKKQLKDAVKPNEYLTRNEVSKILNISLTTLWKYDKKGILPTRKVGGKVRYLRSDVDDAMNNRKINK